jgi:hypothetical protein
MIMLVGIRHTNFNIESYLFVCLKLSTLKCLSYSLYLEVHVKDMTAMKQAL